MKQLLDNLFEQLKLTGSPLISLFQDGLSKKVIEDETNKYGLYFSDDLYELYGWKDGVKGTDDPDWALVELFLLNFGVFRPLALSLETYSLGRTKVWPDLMYPVFQSGAGEAHLINCRKGEHLQSIYYFAPSDYRFSGLITMYDSLPTMILTITECYKTGIYYYNQGDNMLQINDEKEIDLSAQMNPQSEYWKLPM